MSDETWVARATWATRVTEGMAATRPMHAASPTETGGVHTSRPCLTRRWNAARLRRVARARRLAITLTVLGASPAGAQVAVTVDGAGGVVRLADGTRASTTTLSSALEAALGSRLRLTSDLAGEARDGAFDRARGRAALQLATATPWLDLSLDVRANVARLGAPVLRGSVASALRVDARRRNVGAWLGVGGGGSRHGGAGRNFGQSEFGGWWTLGGARLSAAGMVFSTGRLGVPVSTAGAIVRGYSFADVRLGLDWTGRAASFSVFQAQRFGALAGPSRFGGVEAMAALVPGLGVTARLETEPLDPLLHQIARRNVMVGLRLLPPPSRTVMRRPSADDDRSVRLHATADGARALELSIPKARRVEVMGSFSAWEPLELVRVSEGRWRVPGAVPRGLARLLVRIDGGAWQVPAGLPTVDDEFLGAVGVLLVS